MKNVTLTAEEHLIENARRRAARENRTLNAAFREWLTRYAAPETSAKDYRALMQQLSYVRAGRHFTRDEMNER